MQEYTHAKGKGAGKYNGMAKAGDWEGKRIRATRQIRNGGGQGVTPGMKGEVRSAHRQLNVTFDVCEHCGTVMHVSRLNYFDIELA
jgi:hypothetical protein